MLKLIQRQDYQIKKLPFRKFAYSQNALVILVPNTKNRTWKITIHTPEFCYISVFFILWYCRMNWLNSPTWSFLMWQCGWKRFWNDKTTYKDWTLYTVMCVYDVYRFVTVHFMNIMVGLLMYFRSEGGRYRCLPGAYQGSAYGKCTDERTVWVCTVSRRWGGSSFIESAALNTQLLLTW